MSLSMVAITGICAWLAAKGHGVNLTLKASAPGLSADFAITLNERSTPDAVRAQLEAEGVTVPER